MSLGQEIVQVKKLKGLTEEEAIKELKALNLEYEIEEEYDDKVEKGYVIEQSAEEGEEVLAGISIVLTVSKGIEQVDVPNLLGKTESEAKKAITDAKLKWKGTEKISDSNKENGVVVDQSISEGSVVDKDTEITIKVNEFDEVKTAKLTINVKSLTGYTTMYQEDEEGNKVPLDPENVDLKVVVGADTVYKKAVAENSTAVTANASGTGTVTVKVYIDDVLKRTESLNLNSTKSLTID